MSRNSDCRRQLPIEKRHSAKVLKRYDNYSFEQISVFSLRLLRCARNDICHCEEQGDKAVSFAIIDLFLYDDKIDGLQKAQTAAISVNPCSSVGNGLQILA